VREEDKSGVRIVREGPVSSAVEAVTAADIFTQVPVDLICVVVVQRTEVEIEPNERVLAELMVVPGAQGEPGVVGRYLVFEGIGRLDPRLQRL
jgi:stage V sporulation protein SpoVS